MIRRPPRSTRTDTIFPYTTLFRYLARKSGQTNAEFEVNPQTTLTKITSQILSEGEQRALALAGFLTEVALTEGSGPIIVDDPVSSLDRDRSAKVADRIADEAHKRQVVEIGRAWCSERVCQYGSFSVVAV